MSFISFLGNAGWFWIVLALSLLFFKRTRKIGITMAIALVFSLIFTNLLLKPIVDRPRPWVYALEHLGREIQILIEKPHDASFPSGHTSVSFAAATAIFMRNKKYGSLALALAALIGFSRLYFYIHYPTDVLGGLVVGVIYGVAAYFVSNFIIDTVSKKLSNNKEIKS
jgi:undecaprenyl-diphosphatase